MILFSVLLIVPLSGALLSNTDWDTEQILHEETGAETPQEAGISSTEEDEEGEEEEGEKEGEKDSFLEPYYESSDTTGCWLSGCSESWIFLRLITRIDVRYNSNPFRHDGVRTFLGKSGNPFALSVNISMSRTGSGRGYSAEAMFLSPSPIGLEVLYQRVEPGENSKGFTLFYSGPVLQLIFNSPFQLIIGPQAVFPWEDGRWTLTGAGFAVKGKYLFLNGCGISTDYRISWINTLPLHRAEVRFSWFTAPIEFWAGYNFLKNCRNEILHGPCSGVGIFF